MTSEEIAKLVTVVPVGPIFGIPHTGGYSVKVGPHTIYTFHGGEAMRQEANLLQLRLVLALGAALEGWERKP
jgi:hypothetical protein